MSAAESSRHSNVGQFALCIEGLPASYTWQDVKDLARNRAEHGIRADVAYRTGLNGEQIPVHVAKVTRRNEANSLYEWLISGRVEQRTLRVHFFEGPSCIKSNCHLTGSQCSVCRSKQRNESLASYQPAPVPMQQGWAYQTLPMGPANVLPVSSIPPMSPMAYCMPQPTQYAPPPAVQPTGTIDAARLQHTEGVLRAHIAAGNAINPTQEEFLRRMASMRIESPPTQYSSAPTNGPVVAAAASGAPVNTAYGYARTEIRGVFVSGLDFKTKSQDVEDLFGKAGTVKKCQLHVDSRGNGKGTATIEFSTSAEATQAINALNNFPWRGRTLRVRSDREAVVVKAPAANANSSTSRRRVSNNEVNQEPTIVDGSNSRQNRRDSKFAVY